MQQLMYSVLAQESRHVGKMAESQESLDPQPLWRSVQRESTAASSSGDTAHSSGQSGPHRGSRSQKLELIDEDSWINNREPGKMPLFIPDL